MIRPRTPLLGRVRAYLDRDRVDWKYGTETGGTIQMYELGFEAPNLAHANCYRGTLGWVIRRFLRALPINPARYDFIDYGSGKGRALIVAAEFPFAKITGIEFCPTLHATALRNMALVPEAVQGGRVFPLHMDALEFPLPPRDVVCFLYNPFGPAMLDVLLQRFRAHAEAGHDLFAIYINPVHRTLFEKAGFTTVFTHKKGVTYRLEPRR